jgi:hypothetical protein
MISHVLGEAYTGCPWAGFRDPFVAAVARSMPLFKSGSLRDVYPEGVPSVLLEGIRLYESTSNAITAHDHREEARKRKDQAEKKRLSGS